MLMRDDTMSEGVLIIARQRRLEHMLRSSRMLEIDLSEIIELTEEHNRTYRPVAVTEFRSDEKRLYYINADHVSGIDNPTCETIRQALMLFRPDFIIVEGVKSGAERSGVLTFVKEQVESGFIRGGERAYAAFLAIENRIPFSGGEPSDSIILAGMKDKGYSAKDVIAFYLLLAIPQWRREGKLDHYSFPDCAAARLENFRRNLETPQSEALDFAKFVDGVGPDFETSS